MDDDCEQLQDGSEDQPSSGKRGKIRRWTEQEHEMLVQLVEQLGEDACWATIAEHIPGRTGKQCRERWVNHIGSDIKKGNWTAEEEDHMARLHATMGPAWTRIATMLGGRTENSVKNHFNALLRSKRLNDKRSSILAQYVRIVRDKTNSGMAAYEQAVVLAAAADETHSQHSQPSSKSKRSSQQTVSHASHGTDARNSPRAIPLGLGSPMASVGMAGMPNIAAIRTARAGSGALPHTASYPAQLGSPVIVNTPMSGAPMAPHAPPHMPGAHMNDATAALAAAVAAVQAAAQAVAGVASGGGMAQAPTPGMRASGVATGGANYVSRNGSNTLGMGMTPGGMLSCMDGGAASEGVAESVQYSGGMASPGLGGPRAPIPAQSSLSASLNSTMQDDALGTRNSLRVARVGRGGRGRPIGRDVRSMGSGLPGSGQPAGLAGMLDGDEHYPMWQQAGQQCEVTQDLKAEPGLMTVVTGPDGQYQYMGPGAEGRGAACLGGAQGSSGVSCLSDRNQLGMAGSAGGMLGGLPGPEAANSTMLTAVLQEQVAQLAGMLRRPLAAAAAAAAAAAGGPVSGSSENKLDVAALMGSLGGAGLGPGSMGGAGMVPQDGLPGGAFMPDGMLPTTSRYPSLQAAQLQQQQQQQQQGSHVVFGDAEGGDQVTAPKHHSGTMRGATAGGAGPANPNDAAGMGGNSGMGGAAAATAGAEPGAAASAGSLTLGMQELVGGQAGGYNSAFVNQQSLDLGSPRSPPSRPPTGGANANGNPNANAGLHSSMFSLPPHASYDLLTALQQEGSTQEPALLGRLSGLSLDAMLASPLNSRAQSLGHMYFAAAQGGMRVSQGAGLLSLSAHGMGPPPSAGTPGMGGSERGGMPPMSTGGAAMQEQRGMGGSSMGGAPAGMADDLALGGLRPLQVKARKPAAAGDGAAAEPGLASHNSVLPAYVEQEGTPASGAKLLHMPGGGGSSGGGAAMVLNENGTPMANVLTDLLFAWGQEPVTPANAVLAGPGQGPVSYSGAGHMRGGGGPAGDAAAMRGASLPSVPEGAGVNFEYPDQDGFGRPTYSEHNPIHQLFRAQPSSLDGTNTVDVPPPDAMGCLDIIFDEDDTLEGPDGATGGGLCLPPHGSPLLDPQQEMGRFYQQQDQQLQLLQQQQVHLAQPQAAGTMPAQQLLNGGLSPALGGGGPLPAGMIYSPAGGLAGAASAAASFSPQQQQPLSPGQPQAYSPHVRAPQAHTASPLANAPFGLHHMEGHMGGGGMAGSGTLTLEGSLPGALLNLTPGMALTPDMAHRVSAQRQLSLKGGAGMPLAGSAGMMWSQPGPGGTPTGAHTAGSNKRSSTQMWGDPYSPGHSSAKRSTVHATSSPGDPEPMQATPTYMSPAHQHMGPLGLPKPSPLAQRRLAARLPLNDPYGRCTSEPGGAAAAAAAGQQLSAESSGTPHMPPSVQSSPMQHLQGASRGVMPPGGTGSIFTFADRSTQGLAGGMEAPSHMGAYGEDESPAAHMVKSGMDHESALAWSTVFDQHPLQYQQQQQQQQQQLLLQQHMGQYLASNGAGLDSMGPPQMSMVPPPPQPFLGGALQLGGPQGSGGMGPRSLGTGAPGTGALGSKLVGTGNPAPSSAWEDGLIEFGLHAGGMDVPGPGSLHAAMGPKEIASALGAQL